MAQKGVFISKQMLQIKLNNSLIVLPTSRAIREHITSLKNRNQLLKKYITIGDLFFISSLDIKNRKDIDQNLKILFLKEAIKNIDIKKLGFSDNFSTFLNQSDYIFRFFLETANEYISLDKLLEYDTYTLYSDHIEILELIYKNYISLLQENNYTDNILKPSNYIINEDFIKQYDDITINLEGYLSSYEFNIIKNLSKLTTLYINITINHYNEKNIELFEDIDERLEVGYSYKLDFSNKTIVEKYITINNNKNIIISPIKSQISQIAFIKYQITQMIKQGLEPQNIAVIVPDENIINLLELFDNEHYFNFAMGRSIKNNKIVQVSKLLVKYITDFEPKDEEKFKNLNINKKTFETLFKNNWNKDIDKELFETILNYIYSFEEDEQTKEKLEQLKISLEILLFTKVLDNNITLKLKEFMKLFINQLITISVDDTSGGKVTVLGILETRDVQFDGIIVIDFNDNKIPKISVKDKFISSKLKSIVGLPTVEDRENLQRYYYKNIFTKATNIAIGYIDDEQSTMSRFIVQLFPNYKEYLVKYNYNNILYNKKNLNHFLDDIKLDVDLSKKEWSATSLKSYLECKRQYYFKYILNIKDHNISIKPQSFELGSIIHKALETAVKENNFNYDFIKQYLSKNGKNNPYLILELELWNKKLERLFINEKQRKNDGTVIVETEKPFKLKYKDITIKGVIDRIDKLKDNTHEILDYKTSSSLKIDTLKTYENSTDFQLEFYYLSQRELMINSVGYYDLNNSTIKNEIVLDEKLKLLDIHFEALKTKTVDFKLTDDLSKCQYCTYKTICDRGI
ncbi:MAG: PD-(D/E)XK nuclease family protein [Campylobacterota bacterium]|nr:PD-(D/E)XK nuclease family protein [Campylobacterota bacterium]